MSNGIGYDHGMKILLSIILLLPFMASAGSDVYRCKDAEGKIYYSDKECEGGKKMILPPSQTYTPKPSQRKFRYTAPRQKTDQTKYESIKITAPAHDSTIRDNTGNIAVSVSISPTMRTGLGHKLQLYLDGQPYGDAGTATSFNLSNLDRGTHTLKPVILGLSGQVLVEGTASIFHIHRVSILFPPPPPPLPPPPP